MSIDGLKNHVSNISRCEEFRTSFIKRHRSLINAQCLPSSVFTLDVACNYVFILGGGEGKIRVDSRILAFGARAL